MQMRLGLLAIAGVMVLSLGVHLGVAQEVDISGDWEGAIVIPGGELGIEVTFKRGEDAQGWVSTISIPTQNLNDQALEQVSLEGRAIRFVLPGIPGDPTFEGEVGEDGASMGGPFTQGGANLTWSLERAGANDAIFTERAEAFAAWFDGAREAWDVPGAAVCIVRGDEVLLSRGFGMRDVDEGLPATADTLFAIGSCSKSFTAMLLAQLVESGDVSWSDKVREHVPEFRLKDESIAAEMTVRDLVTHRSGLPRHDMSWYGNPGATRDDLLAAMAHIEATAGLRETWQYNNLMFMTAGIVVERVTGASWERNVEERIFGPLGMSRSNMSIEALTADADHARPYMDWEDEIREIDYRLITAMGPAGSINSSSTEMGAWLIAQLNGGEYGDGRLVEASSMTEMHRPQMLMAGGGNAMITPLGYAMGWMVDIYRDQLRVSHGGGIDGFVSLVTLIPGERIGIVVLTNSASGLPGIATQHAIDGLLELETMDWSAIGLAAAEQTEGALETSDAAMEAARIADAPASRGLDAFAGRYVHPGYGVIEVLQEEDGLVAHVNNMRAPLEHWHFDVFRFGESDDIVLRHQLVQFVAGLDGKVTGLQWKAEPTLKAAVFERRDVFELSEADLEAFVGKYKLEVGETVGIERRGESLVGTYPGQSAIKLHPVGVDEFELDGLDGFRVRFLRGDGGSIEAAEFTQPNGVFRGARVEE